MTLADLVVIEKFCPDFPLPDINNNLYFATDVVRNSSGQIVAGAFIKLTSELILIADPSLSRITRARLFNGLVNQAMTTLKTHGLDDTHVFILGPESAKTAAVLVKHHDFVPATGIPLYKGNI